LLKSNNRRVILPQSRSLHPPGFSGWAGPFSGEKHIIEAYGDYMNNTELQQHVQAVAQEISTYIDKRPNAAETVEGVTNWWISRQRFAESAAVVESAPFFR
jgi:hypothetical protein